MYRLSSNLKVKGAGSQGPRNSSQGERLQGFSRVRRSIPELTDLKRTVGLLVRVTKFPLLKFRLENFVVIYETGRSTDLISLNQPSFGCKFLEVRKDPFLTVTWKVQIFLRSVLTVTLLFLLLLFLSPINNILRCATYL